MREKEVPIKHEDVQFLWKILNKICQSGLEEHPSRALRQLQAYGVNFAQSSCRILLSMTHRIDKDKLYRLCTADRWVQDDDPCTLGYCTVWTRACARVGDVSTTANQVKTPKGGQDLRGWEKAIVDLWGNVEMPPMSNSNRAVSVCCCWRVCLRERVRVGTKKRRSPKAKSTESLHRSVQRSYLIRKKLSVGQICTLSCARWTLRRRRPIRTFLSLPQATPRKSWNQKRKPQESVATSDCLPSFC